MGVRAVAQIRNSPSYRENQVLTAILAADASPPPGGCTNPAIGHRAAAAQNAKDVVVRVADWGALAERLRV